MRTTLDLSDALFRELKTRAASRGVTMKDLLNELITAELRAPRTGTAVFKRSPLPLARRASSKRRIPARSNAEMQHILDEEDARGARVYVDD